MYSLMMLNPDVVDPVSKAIRQDKRDRATKTSASDEIVVDWKEIETTCTDWCVE